MLIWVTVVAFFTVNDGPDGMVTTAVDGFDVTGTGFGLTSAVAVAIAVFVTKPASASA